MRERHGLARVWLGPEPERGAHSSIVGVVTADALGVHVPIDAASNIIDLAEEEGEDWPLGLWLWWGDEPSTIPWHRVNMIDWCDGENETVQSVVGKHEIR